MSATLFLSMDGSSVRRHLKLAIGLALLPLLLLAVAALVLYRGTQHVPEFYRQTLAPAASPQQQIEAGDNFERQVLELHNATAKPGRWDAEFTDEQVNAWLAAFLPRNHPHALPADVREPRVKLSPRSAQVAWRQRHGWLETVISLQADVYLTDQPNQIAIQVRAVRAGWVPLPLAEIVDGVSTAARDGGLDLTWSQHEGDPVALLRVPVRHPQYEHRELHLDTLELEDGKLRLSGLTERSS
jgi:hypothetical protein